MVEVAAAIMLNADRVLIARRRAGLRHAGKWEFPGGKIERGETPQQCLIRELREEFDIRVEIGPFFGENTHQYQRGPVRIVSYCVRWLSGNLTLKDHDTWQWVSPQTLKDYDLLPGDVPLAQRLDNVYREKGSLAYFEPVQNGST